jgi:predicted nucleic acid-binding protein
MILLDTNVISELMRPLPDPDAVAWLSRHPRRNLWTSSVVIAELLSGIELMHSGRKQRVLREAVEGMISEDFRGQILEFDLESARQYGLVLSTRQRMGRPIHEMDAQIAAIARVHNATLATRNISDFLSCDVALVNPWPDEP